MHGLGAHQGDAAVAVLASACGLSSDTCGRLWVLVTSRATSSVATCLERMLVPRSACTVKVAQSDALLCDGIAD